MMTAPGGKTDQVPDTHFCRANVVGSLLHSFTVRQSFPMALDTSDLMSNLTTIIDEVDRVVEFSEQSITRMGEHDLNVDGYFTDEVNKLLRGKLITKIEEKFKNWYTKCYSAFQPYADGAIGGGVVLDSKDDIPDVIQIMEDYGLSGQAVEMDAEPRGYVSRHSGALLGEYAGQATYDKVKNKAIYFLLQKPGADGSLGAMPDEENVSSLCIGQVPLYQ